MLPTVQPPDPDTRPPTPPAGSPPPADDPGAAGQRWDRSQGLQLGRHRYLRSSDDRVVAGVAGGLADLTGIDPIVWRIGFVILTLSGGLGVLLYLALWLLAPERAPGSTVARPARTDGWDWRSLLGIVLAGIALLTILPFSGDGGLLAGLLLLGVGAWLWSTGRPTPAAPPPGVSPTSQAWTPTQGGTGANVAAAAAPTPGSAIPVTTGAGDADAAATVELPVADVTSPAGATPWPTPAGAPPVAPQGPPPAVQPVPPRERSILGRLTFALALLLVGVAALADEVGWVRTDPGEVASWTLVVLGLGLLVGAWVGRARWLALVALVVLPVAVVGTVVSGLDLDLGGEVVDMRVTPASVAELPTDGYRYAAGELVVDLRGLDGDTVEPIEVRLGAGTVLVLLPTDAAGEVDARLGVGALDAFGRQEEGVGPRMDDVRFGPADAARTIDVDVRVGAGEVRVELLDPVDADATSDDAEVVP